MEILLDRAGGPGLMFDIDRSHAADRAIHVCTAQPAGALWIIGDLHGDLLASRRRWRRYAATRSRKTAPHHASSFSATSSTMMV
jgi:hypothetical protein